MFLEPLMYLGPLFILMAIPMILKKVPPNPLYGIRTEKLLTPGNEELWYKANKYGGQQLLIAGLVFTVFIVLLFTTEGKVPFVVELILFCAAFGAIVVALIRSLLYVKKL